MIPHLPPTYVDHLVAPRGTLDLPAAEAAGHQGSMVGGTGVRVTLAWRAGPGGEARVREAGVRVFGSAGPVAPASCLAQRLVGLTPEEAAALEPGHLLAALAGDADLAALPPAVHRGARMVVEALRCALGLPYCRPADPKGPGILVCRCLGVGDRQVRAVIARGAATPEALGVHCGAGTGCGSCRPDLQVLLREESRPPPPPPDPALPPVARIAWARVGPLLDAQGRPLRDVEVTGDRVTLRLGPPRPGSILSPAGAEEIARAVLRDTVAEGILIRVEAS